MRSKDSRPVWGEGAGKVPDGNSPTPYSTSSTVLGAPGGEIPPGDSPDKGAACPARCPDAGPWCIDPWVVLCFLRVRPNRKSNNIQILHRVILSMHQHPGASDSAAGRAKPGSAAAEVQGWGCSPSPNRHFEVAPSLSYVSRKQSGRASRHDDDPALLRQRRCLWPWPGRQRRRNCRASHSQRTCRRPCPLQRSPPARS